MMPQVGVVGVVGLVVTVQMSVHYLKYNTIAGKLGSTHNQAL